MTRTTGQAGTTTTSHSEAGPVRGGPGEFWRRVWLLALALLLMSVVGSCRSRGALPAPSASASSMSVAPEPEPSGVLAELFVAHPDQAWGRFQPLLGAAIGFKPVTLSATLTDLLGIPAAYSPGVAIEKPIVGVLVDGDSPRAVVGIRMTSGAELVAALSTGRSPTHRARSLENGKVTLLEPQRRAPVGDLAIGVCGNTLLVGVHGADLAKYGPYVARGLPSRLEPSAGRGSAKGGGPTRPPEGSLVFVVPGHTLRGTVVERLRVWWTHTRRRLERQALDQQRRHDDRAPDFAEPEAVISGTDQLARQAFGVLGSAGTLAVVVEPSGGIVELRLVLTSGRRGAVAQLAHSLPEGDSRALLRLPRRTVAAATCASTGLGRKAVGLRLAAALTELFGSRLGTSDRSLIEKTFDDLGRGGGDDLSLGLVATPDGAGVAVGAAVRDAGLLDDGIRGGLRSLQLSAFAEPFAAFVGRPRVAIDSTTIAGLRQPVTRARIVWLAKAPATAPPPTKFLWTVDGGRLHAAVGPAAEPILVAHVRAAVDEASSLGADEQLVTAVGRAPPGSTMTLFARPDAIGWARPSAPVQPLVLSMGSVGEDLTIRLELDHETLASTLRSILGLRSHRE